MFFTSSCLPKWCLTTFQGTKFIITHGFGRNIISPKNKMKFSKTQVLAKEKWLAAQCAVHLQCTQHGLAGWLAAQTSQKKSRGEVPFVMMDVSVEPRAEPAQRIWKRRRVVNNSQSVYRYQCARALCWHSCVYVCMCVRARTSPFLLFYAPQRFAAVPFCCALGSTYYLKSSSI